MKPDVKKTVQGARTDATDATASALFEEYGSSLMRYLVFRVGNESDASDLSQEAYLRLTRVARADLIEKPAAYLFRIAANLANEFHLRHQRAPTTVPLESMESHLSDAGAFERQMEARSAIQALDVLLNQMPPLYKAVLLLRKRDGLSHAEIAQKLDLSPHTVHKYLTRALAQCRDAWGDA